MGRRTHHWAGMPQHANGESASGRVRRADARRRGEEPGQVLTVRRPAIEAGRWDGTNDRCATKCTVT